MSRSRFTLRGLDSVPPHANAEAHKKVMARLKTMTQREFFESLVHAGIYTPGGKLTKKYAGASDLPHVLTPEQMGLATREKAKKATRPVPRRASAKTAARKSTGATRRKTVKASRR